MIHPPDRKTASSSRAAFSLVEVTLAIGVTAFCLLALFGLLPIGLNVSHTSIEQTASNNLLSMICADLRSTRNATSSEVAARTPVVSSQFQLPVPTNPVSASAPLTCFFTKDGRQVLGADGEPADVPTADSRYRITLQFLPNSAGEPTYLTLLASWPAEALPENAGGTVQVFAALNRN